MPRSAPGRDCYDLGFSVGYPMSEEGEVALEDYARVLLSGREAEAIRAADDPGVVTGVHLCGAKRTLTGALSNDLQDFARSVALKGDRDPGLGWS